MEESRLNVIKRLDQEARLKIKVCDSERHPNGRKWRSL